MVSITSDDSDAYGIINNYEIFKIEDLEDINLESNYEESTDFDNEDYILMNIDLEGLDL